MWKLYSNLLVIGQTTTLLASRWGWSEILPVFTILLVGLVWGFLSAEPAVDTQAFAVDVRLWKLALSGLFWLLVTIGFAAIHRFQVATWVYPVQFLLGLGHGICLCALNGRKREMAAL